MDVAKKFVAGIITIGIISALVLNGKSTAGVIKATGDAASGLLGTAIKG